MCRLKYLNLDNNEIYTIPHLKLLGTSPLKAAKSAEPIAAGGESPDVGTPPRIHSRSTLAASQESGSDGGQVGWKEMIESDDEVEATKEAKEVIDEQVGKENGKQGTLRMKSELSSSSQTTGGRDDFKATTSECVEEEILADPSHEQSQKNPLHSEVSHTPGKCTTTPPPLHTVTTHTNRPVLTSPKSNDEKQRVIHEGDLQPTSDGDEQLKELAPFPQLETLSLVNNLVYM